MLQGKVLCCKARCAPKQHSSPCTRAVKQLSNQCVAPLLQLPASHGEGASFTDSAQPYMHVARAAVEQQAAAQGLAARITNAAAFPGCVHVLLNVRLEPLPAGQAGGGGAQDVSDAQLQLLAAHISCSMGQAVEVRQLAAGDGRALVPAAVLAAAVEPCDEDGWLDLRTAALATPVCVSTAAAGPAAEDPGVAAAPGNSPAGGSSSTVAVGLLPHCPSGLPARPKVVVAGQSASGSSCRVLGAGPVWTSPAGQVHRHMAVHLPAFDSPTALTLHVLPAEGAAATGPAGSAQVHPTGPAGSAQVHPIASLPLLALPAPCCDEVLAMFSGALQELQQQAGGGEAQAARRAYWGHYVPFVQIWEGLLAAAQSAAGGAPADSEAAVSDAASLLTFLAAQGMPACLQLAAGLLHTAGLDEAVAAALTAEVLDAAPAAAAAATAQRSWTPTADGVALRQQQQQGEPREQDVVKSAAAAAVASMPQGAAGPSSKLSGTATPAPAPPTSPPASASCAPSPPPSWRAALLGSPDPAMEAAYLAFKNRRATVQVDCSGPLVTSLLAALRLHTLSKGRANGAHWLDIAAACIKLLMYIWCLSPCCCWPGAGTCSTGRGCCW